MEESSFKPLIVPERIIPSPSHLSDKARTMLNPFPSPMSAPFPNVEDKNAWRTYVKTIDDAVLPITKTFAPQGEFSIESIEIDETKVHIITPEGIDPEDHTIIFDMHGGALIFCGGEFVIEMAKLTASRLKKRVWSVDYRMAPDHPFPAALEDGQKVYKALLKRYKPEEIVMHGLSAGGNLIAATLLKCRDEGMPLPAAIILQTPEADLTESGDSFLTNAALDNFCGALMPVNLLYANGHDLKDPYISPLFADFTLGFPPTLLTTGTRDIFLSNTVRLHRALRAANIPAELHVMEAGPHGNLSSTDECEAIDQDVRKFIKKHTT